MWELRDKNFEEVSGMRDLIMWREKDVKGAKRLEWEI